jgi:hypothetical protein
MTKIQMLREALAKLEDADELVFAALGDSDACIFTREAIQEAILDIRCDIVELEG